MDCSLPGFSVRVIFQARILEWVAISSSQDRTHVSCISRWILYHRTTWWICLLFQYVTSGFMLSFISSVKGEEQFFFCFLPPFSLGFPCGSASKESACNAGDLCLIPGLGGSSGEGNGNPLQYSCSENSMGRGAWKATVHWVAQSWTWLSTDTLTGDTGSFPAPERFHMLRETKPVHHKNNNNNMNKNS